MPAPAIPAKQVDRLIPLEGCRNFRDLGGYPAAGGLRVRWRRLFRSDALHRLTAEDIGRLRDDIGIDTVIDLRSTAELRSEGRGLLEAHPVRFHHVPLFDGIPAEAREQAAGLALADRYVLLAEFARPSIGRVLTLLASASGPTVFHCAAGKDRTGVVAAIVLSLLGVDEAAIVADYTATRAQLDAIVDRLRESPGYQTMLDALPPDTLHAEPETMQEFLRRLACAWGEPAAYARAAGIDDTILRRLRERFLEPD